MDRFVEILDELAVRSVNLVGASQFCRYATTTADWAKQNFYPKTGVVGQVIGEIQSREGLLYLVQVTDTIVVAVLPSGLRDISLAEVNARYVLNMSIGHISAAEAQEYEIREMQKEMDNLMQSFM